MLCAVFRALCSVQGELLAVSAESGHTPLAEVSINQLCDAGCQPQTGTSHVRIDSACKGHHGVCPSHTASIRT